jgi:hypothetical protein
MEHYPMLQGKLHLFFCLKHHFFFSFRQPTSLNGGQKVQNPYYANPFFRPKVVTNQQPTTSTTLAAPSRDSSTVTTNVTIQTLTSSASTIPNRGRQPIYPKDQNSHLLTNGRIQESELTVITSPVQDDGRRWAHTVASAPIVRRAISDERPNRTLKPSETTVSHLNTIYLSIFIYLKDNKSNK